VADKVTVNLGVRYDAQYFYRQTGEVGLSLPNQWSPRLGLIYDPTQQGKAKMFVNYARYYENAPLDFADKQAISFARSVDARHLNIDKLLDTYGNMPPDLIEYGAKALKPVENYIGSYLRAWDNLDDPRIVESWHAMHTWVTDNIPMAGASFLQTRF